MHTTMLMKSQQKKEIAMELLPMLGLFALMGLSYFLLQISRTFRNKQKREPPHAAGSWPIIGHLHLLSGSQSKLPHITLGALADKYGPIFTINWGMHKVLVASDSRIAKEIFTTNDKVFASRPRSIGVEVMGYNYAIFGLTPYGQYWREVRKIVMLEVLSNRRLEMLREIRVSEVRTSVKDMYALWVESTKGCLNGTAKMEMKQWFGSLVQNFVLRMVAGKRFSHDDEEAVRFEKTSRRFFELMGTFLVSDAIPFLRWLDLDGYEKEMKAVGKGIDDILERWLQEHKRMRGSEEQTRGGTTQDFMDVILSIVEDESAKDRLPGFDPDTICKATSMTILLGATDTTSVTMAWALSLLLNNPEALAKARQELDTQVGLNRQVEESDMKNLVYLQAIIKETLRLRPPGQLIVPHLAMEDCTVGGYHIPKGTQLLTNLWKIHHDEKVWEEPHEFRPERFLTSLKDVDVRGQDFELIPFGSGRRICPGISFALQIMQLALASLIHGFEIEKPSDEAIDMSEVYGLTVMKATPLDVVFKPRLCPSLYE